MGSTGRGRPCLYPTNVFPTQDADLPLDLGGLFAAWVGKDRKLTNSAVLSVEDCTYFSIKSSRLMGADVPDLFLVPS